MHIVEEILGRQALELYPKLYRKESTWKQRNDCKSKHKLHCHQKSIESHLDILTVKYIAIVHKKPLCSSSVYIQKDY
jgi:hypothetical protein